MAAVAPSVVAQRLCDLLQMFPSAAVGGIQWKTLASKYEQRFSTQLDLLEMGHDSALAAATALLWDVLRLVQSDDLDNPVVALEDVVALVPRPGRLASWPSLYKALCEIAVSHGTHGTSSEEERDGELSHEVLFSQLKPLLQAHWHNCFDEGSLCYMTDEGSLVKLKKMKHLLQATLRWREQRVAWQQEVGSNVGSVDEVLRPRLELTPSKKHNDLLLRCVRPKLLVQIPAPFPAASDEPEHANETVPCPDVEAPESARSRSSCGAGGRSWSHSSGASTRETGSGSSSDLTQELISLRAENAMLRNANALLQQAGDAALRAELFGTPPRQDSTLEDLEIFDNPFEPPPQVWCRSHRDSIGSNASTGTPGSAPGIATPLTQPNMGSHVASGSATPGVGQAAGQMCTFFPLWFPMGDRLQIPQGVVQQARAFFEREGNGSVPSFFVQG
mmetsp:Transcript_120544/g.239977  ORF Transcript_120544/g.239977 Transcript_120544/m.239977 type:complete len:446 (-) Transcript_120544:44-1381(-)|eukprot:CAMPEP_0172809764 /NCGR_PEP_ID=MMETSP1075-20121228/8404_1 /TAXON_ID=2916 /ORGANISM="Ceratium fusus, Strain PA161109" /LENGTH=445 /DNA_ID=CAMNT_0013649005 /DNA_START=41 /DNA_END=1378 /DNA_ORIENTATION=+